ncbi:MAG: hypothetical protein RLZ98_3339 [Pseudomonadota bacterium]|jgi:hypothetical protein
MLKKIIAALVLAAFALASAPVVMEATVAAQSTQKSAKKASKPKVGKNQKLCQYRFPDGERRSWVCDKAVPCCAWDAIKYVKCGTTITGCL